MADPVFIPNLSRQPASVDFIDNRLSKYHPAFVNPPVRYDPMSGKYTQNSLVPVAISNHGVLTTPGAAVAALPDDSGLPARPLWTTTRAMSYWNDMFPQAMNSFRSTPGLKGGPRPDYNIRDKDNWDAVYDVLVAARTQYQHKGGTVGFIRKVRRMAADSIGPAAEVAHVASKVAPSDPYATPVLGAVEVLLDVVKNAAGVRKQALESFDDLVYKFSEVEVFLGSFRRDQNIWNASLELTIATLDAVERTIAFFLSSDFQKGARALFRGSGYQSDLLESLGKIKEKSEVLMREANKSHIYETHFDSSESQRFRREIPEQLQQLGIGLHNTLNGLLAEQAQRMQAKFDSRLKAAEQRIALTIQNEMFQQRRLTPSPTPMVMEYFVNQEALRRMLNIPDIDLIDAAFVADKKAQLPPRELAQAEQIVNTQLFRDWMVSDSARLLVQWDVPTPPRTVAGVSPLSVFCTTMVRALQARGPSFLPLVWFCGRHVDAAEADHGGFVGARSMLPSLIDQLLRQHDFDTRPLHHDLNLSALQTRGSDELARLLGWLVRRLPPTTTVVIIVDGVALLEREEFQEEAVPALLSLLQLAADPSVPAAVKLLFASTPGTDDVRAAFEQDGLVLDVGTLPLIAWAPSEERFNRDMGGS